METFVLFLIFFASFLQALPCWETTEFVSGASITHSCDIGCPQNPRTFFTSPITFDATLYQDISEGNTVFLPCADVPNFFRYVLPHCQNPFVLVINDPRDGDASFPSDLPKEFDVEEFLRHPLILHLFAQNCDYAGTSKKVSHLPIGIDFHTIGYKSDEGGWGEKGSPHAQETILKNIISHSLPTRARKPIAFVDFHHSDTMHAGFQRYLQFGEDRRTIFANLLPTGLIEHGPWMKRYALWQKKSEYAFSISPHGNGLDCHRTWEDLALGCIVIVKTSPLDPLYEGLPVVIVQHWSEITKENMELWLEKYGDALENPSYREKLTHTYWQNKIKAYSQLPVAQAVPANS